MDNPNYMVLKLEGNLDTYTASQVETPFYAKVGAAKAGKDIVVIDLKEVSFLSSLGIRILFTTAKMLKKRAIPCAFLQPSAEVALSALELSGINTSVPSYATLEEAKQKFPISINS
ncbi:MAG: STAS domain-containing protein [Hyphomicrobium sp.]